MHRLSNETCSVDDFQCPNSDPCASSTNCFSAHNDSSASPRLFLYVHWVPILLTQIQLRRWKDTGSGLGGLGWPGPEHLPRQCFRRPGHWNQRQGASNSHHVLPSPASSISSKNSYTEAMGKSSEATTAYLKQWSRGEKQNIAVRGGREREVWKIDPLRWSSLLYKGAAKCNSGPNCPYQKWIWTDHCFNMLSPSSQGANFLGYRQWSREYHLWRRACASGRLQSAQSLRVVLLLRNTISRCFEMFRYEGFLKWGYPKIIHSSIWVGLSIINHAFRGNHIFGHLHMLQFLPGSQQSWRCLAWIEVSLKLQPHEGRLEKPRQIRMSGLNRRKCNAKMIKHGMFILFECQAFAPSPPRMLSCS